MRFPLFLAVAVLVAGAAMSGCLQVGSNAAEDLVSSERYTKLIVEVDYVTAPRQNAVDLLAKRIDERLSKPGGVEFDKTSISSSDTSYDERDLKEMESTNRDRRTGGSTAVLYILYLNGHWHEDRSDAKVLGVQYGGSSIAIFKETIDSSSGILGIAFSPSELEEAVLVHEFGHAIGLVNKGLPMVTPHEDPNHRHHSSNEGSVMYWAIENTLGLRELTGSIPDDFDSNDKADIKAAGGK